MTVDQFERYYTLANTFKTTFLDQTNVSTPFMITWRIQWGFKEFMRNLNSKGLNAVSLGDHLLVFSSEFMTRLYVSLFVI